MKRDWATTKILNAGLAAMYDREVIAKKAAKLLRAERARARRVVTTQRKLYQQLHAEWLEKVGNRPLVQCFKAKADACEELVRRLG